MRTSATLRLLSAGLLLLVVVGCNATQAQGERYYYGIEINDTLCGYGEVDVSTLDQDGTAITRLHQETFLMLTLLGSEVNTRVDATYDVDNATGKVVHHDSEVHQGNQNMRFTVDAEEDGIHYTSTLKRVDKTIQLSPDVILENNLFFPHLKEDFVDRDLEQKSYPIFQVAEGEVQEVDFTRVRTERLELAGATYDAIVLDGLNRTTGMKVRSWIDITNGQVLKAELPNHRSVYLADPSVKKKIELADVDQNIMSKVGVSIPDVQAITYMKVRATIEPLGLWVTPESLNVPGQRFTGTVDNNRVEGVFEVEHRRYDGTNAPAFPVQAPVDESLAEYLKPEGWIESDDAVLIEKAREITRGSKDSWDAARRISRWVADNIDYAVPGGGTARKTYDLRAGECGAHSNLVAAFCRAVGIPARVVWGCMYVSNHGGAFGQHGWNEVHMGDAGWVPLDATAFEVDFVDSGHIRVGAHESVSTELNPVAIEVLDYRVESSAAGLSEDEVLDKYEPYLGKYTNPQTGTVVEVLVQNGGLVLDIPEQATLPMEDPDRDGVWYCKLSNKLFLVFEEDGAGGQIARMQLHELVRLRRTAEPDVADERAPEGLRRYLGKYLLAQLNAEFTVIHRGDGLAVEDPLNKTTVRLRPPDAKGGWLDEFEKNTIFFTTDDDGVVTEMTIDSVNEFRR